MDQLGPLHEAPDQQRRT